MGASGDHRNRGAGLGSEQYSSDSVDTVVGCRRAKASRLELRGFAVPGRVLYAPLPGLGWLPNTPVPQVLVVGAIVACGDWQRYADEAKRRQEAGKAAGTDDAGEKEALLAGDEEQEGEDFQGIE